MEVGERHLSSRVFNLIAMVTLVVMASNLAYFDLAFAVEERCQTPEFPAAEQC